MSMGILFLKELYVMRMFMLQDENTAARNNLVPFFLAQMLLEHKEQDIISEFCKGIHHGQFSAIFV